MKNVFEPGLTTPATDAESAVDGDKDESEIPSWEVKAPLLRLMEFCSFESMQIWEMVKFTLYPGAFDGAGCG